MLLWKEVAGILWGHCADLGLSISGLVMAGKSVLFWLNDGGQVSSPCSQNILTDRSDTVN